MVNEGQSRATGALFFLKTGCPNEVLVVSGNRATGQLLISSTGVQYISSLGLDLLFLSVRKFNVSLWWINY